MKNVTVLGIDLAKDVFQLHGVNEHGKKVLGKKLSRSALPNFIANLPPCNIAMEACGSANYWSRKFMSYGHAVSQISPQHVKPFVQGNKNDKHDARAIVIAFQQDDMPTVSIKRIEQQEVQMLHLMKLSGVGPMIASIVYATTGDPNNFKHGRHFAAFQSANIIKAQTRQYVVY